MFEEFRVVIPFRRLTELGMKGETHSLREKYLRLSVDEEVKKHNRSNQVVPWHYVNIWYSSITETYHITVAPGFTIKKG